MARASTWLKACGAGSAAVAGPVVLAGKTGVPEGAWWDSATDPAVLAAGALTAAALGYGLYKVFDEFVADRKRAAARRTELMEEICRSAMVPIAAALPGVPLNMLGIHVWAVDTKDARLKRVIKYTMDLDRQDTIMDWTMGKGVIGHVWQTGAFLAVDLSELIELAERSSAEDFDAIASDVRYGMSREEAIRARRYGCILAVPLSSADDDPPKRVIGVVSVDCVEAGHRDALAGLLDDPTFGNVVGTCQNYLRTHMAAGEI